MPKAVLISPITKQGIQKTRVAAYCRVSSNSADQLNSYATQIRVYTKLINSKKELAENVIGAGGENWITELGDREILDLMRLEI